MECKEERGIIMRKSVFVLIETLWNVKHKKKTCETPAPGINRNIMECKVISQYPDAKAIKSINRNIMECKGRNVITTCVACEY